MKLTIPTPCSENWDAMTPTACGRSCAVCQKEVIDVTQMDDSSILQKYSDNGGNLCIRARAEQISPVMTVRTFPMQRLAVFALAVWLVFAGGLVSEAVGQTDSVRIINANIGQNFFNESVLKIEVRTEGEKTEGLEIRVYNSVSQLAFLGKTDENGIVSIHQLPPDQYQLNVCRNDTIQSQKINISPASFTAIIIDLVSGYTTGPISSMEMDSPTQIKHSYPRRTTFNLQDIRRIPNNR